MMDPNVLNSDHAPSRSTILDVALQIGLVGLVGLRLQPVSYRLLPTSCSGLQFWR